jgi:hypothetical protein
VGEPPFATVPPTIEYSFMEKGETTTYHFYTNGEEMLIYDKNIFFHPNTVCLMPRIFYNLVMARGVPIIVSTPIF